MVALIQKSGKDLLTIIDDILTFTKSESGQIDIESIPVSPREILHETVRMLAPRLVGKPEVELLQEVIEPIPEFILSDPTRLRQILTNLAGNAIKFTSKGTVRIVCEMQKESTILGESRLFFHVIDSGIGIAPEQLDRLFTPFFQADSSTTRKYGGTGLGLSISKRLAILLGGDLAVQSVPKQGSTFTLMLLVRIPAEEDWKQLQKTGTTRISAPHTNANANPNSNTNTNTNTHAIRSASGPATPHSSGIGTANLESSQESFRDRPSASEKEKSAEPLEHLRVLLVEDGKINQIVIRSQLQEAGAEVFLADNGQEGIDTIFREQAAGRRFDVVLMDMQMPVMDGIEATKSLREKNYSGPIIAVTAHAFEEDRQHALEAGCNAHISKPVDYDTMIKTICRTIQNHDSTRK